MKLKHLIAVIAILACVYLGVQTLTHHGSHAVADRSSSGPKMHGVGMGGGSEMEFADPSYIALISAIIVSQLNAFKSNNYQQASTFVYSRIIPRLGSPDHFHQVMATRYPEIADYQSVFFGPLITTFDRKTVEGVVDVTGVDGITRKAVYILVRDQGVYRIVGIVGGDSGTRRGLIHFNLAPSYVKHFIKFDNSI
jgi:hypothetical protein